MRCRISARSAVASVALVPECGKTGFRTATFTEAGGNGSGKKRHHLKPHFLKILFPA
jgi:hypothetical protein